MNLPKEIDLAPELLSYLRSSYNGTLKEHAEKTGYLEEEIATWETTGRAVPLRLIRNYQSVYKKPIAFFLLPEPPKEKIRPQKLRTHKNIPVGDFTKETVLEAEKIANRIELLEDVGLLPNINVKFDTLPSQSNAREYAVKVRSLLEIDNISLKTRKWLKYWVDKLESAGILISQTSLQEKLSGFLYTSENDNTVIVLNTGEPETRRLFTLAHELGHLIMGRKNKNLTYEAEERFCNSFAGNLLVPRSILVGNREINDYINDGLRDRDLKAFARSYGISPEMVLRRLLDEKLSPEIDSIFYEEWKARYEAEGGDFIKRSVGGGGLTYYYTLYNQLGHKVSRLLFKARSEGLIDTPTFVSQTGLRSNHIRKFSGVALLDQ